MPGFFAKFLLTLIISNWIYSEISLFWPGFQDISTRLAEKARIPTHDEWPDIFDSNRALALSAELDTLLASSSVQHIFPALQPPQRIAKASSTLGLTHNTYRYSNFVACEDSPFFSGENLFSRRNFGAYRYFFFPG